LEADPRPALEDAKPLESLLSQLDGVLAKRPKAPVTGNAAAPLFEKVVALRSDGDLALREGKFNDAQRHYKEASDSYPRLAAPFDSSAAAARQQGWAEALGKDVVITNDAGIGLALIPPGDFQMGTSDDEVKQLLSWDGDLSRKDFQNEQPQHRVRISRPFRLAVHETTQAEYVKVMGKNPSWATLRQTKLKDTLRLPVENVTWLEAVEFCNELSRREELTLYYTVERDAESTVTRVRSAEGDGRGYRLPTEAEWEYACRAGTQSLFNFGSALDGHAANVDGDYPLGSESTGVNLARVAKVGSFPANPFGLFDMHGNVWEWCHDHYQELAYGVFAARPAEDPVGAGATRLRVLRGGSWLNAARNARSAVRVGRAMDYHDLHIGFRVARSED
jgi:formylglycine-generating enzyme required for sulfatase activity